MVYMLTLRFAGSPDRAAIDNFYRVNQWNFLLIGEKVRPGQR